MIELLKELLGSAAGVALLTTIGGGLFAGLKWIFSWFGNRRSRLMARLAAAAALETAAEAARQKLIADLRKDLDELRMRVSQMEKSISEKNARLLALYNKYVFLATKYNAVVSAITVQGSEESKKHVERVLSSFGVNLSEFDPNDMPDYDFDFLEESTMRERRTQAVVHEAEVKDPPR